SAIAGGAAQSVAQSVAQPSPMPAPQPAAVQQAPAVQLRSLADCAALASERRDIPLKVSIERQMRLVKFEPGRIEIQPTKDAGADLAGEFGRKLTEWTGMRWIVSVSREQGRPTIHEEREATQAQLLSDARSHPTVAALLAEFPGARVVDVRVNEEEESIDDPLLAEALGTDDDDL
ncbi:MAG: DNA polymerase III subunit gamma/tau, partial [Pannonibacter indicus]